MAPSKGSRVPQRSHPRPHVGTPPKIAVLSVATGLDEFVLGWFNQSEWQDTPTGQHTSPSGLASRKNGGRLLQRGIAIDHWVGKPIEETRSKKGALADARLGTNRKPTTGGFLSKLFENRQSNEGKKIRSAKDSQDREGTNGE